MSLEGFLVLFLSQNDVLCSFWYRAIWNGENLPRSFYTVSVLDNGDERIWLEGQRPKTLAHADTDRW